MEFRTGDDAAMGLEQTLTTATPAPPAAPRKAAVSMEQQDNGSDALIAAKAGEALAVAMAQAATADAAASDTVLREALQILADYVQLLGPVLAQGKQAA